MDHKVSKDMISSGMIPSGEKTQADLGRTQYGSAPSPSSLMDAYKSIYEHHQKDADGKVIEHDEKEELNEGKMPEGLKNYLMKKKGKKEDKKEIKEVAITGGMLAKAALTGAATQAGAQAMSGAMNNTGVKKKPTNSNISAKSNVTAGADLFDIVKGKLLDEGLSEEEIKDIMLTLTPDEILKEIEESSMSDGSAGGAYQDLGPGGFRSREQINRMHNDPKGTEKYGKKIMKRVGQAVRDTGTPTVRKVDESKK